jgi:hypothetical protein
VKKVIPIAVTIGFGVIVLISLLLRLPVLEAPRQVIVQWAVVLAAFALVLGWINLMVVHFRRFQSRQNMIYSLVLIISAGITLALWIASMAAGESAEVMRSIFDRVIAPFQAALGALLALVLAVAGFRALRVRRSLGMILFVLTAVVVVLTQPLGLLSDVLDLIRGNLIDPITTGSLRGVLLGVALGSIAVGLRVLTGADRPQSD